MRHTQSQDPRGPNQTQSQNESPMGGQKTHLSSGLFDPPYMAFFSASLVLLTFVDRSPLNDINLVASMMQRFVRCYRIAKLRFFVQLIRVQTGLSHIVEGKSLFLDNCPLVFLSYGSLWFKGRRCAGEELKKRGIEIDIKFREL